MKLVYNYSLESFIIKIIYTILAKEFKKKLIIIIFNNNQIILKMMKYQKQ